MGKISVMVSKVASCMMRCYGVSYLMGSRIVAVKPRRTNLACIRGISAESNKAITLFMLTRLSDVTLLVSLMMLRSAIKRLHMASMYLSIRLSAAIMSMLVLLM
jgi:hypothetical protein